jgi:hypothetical protein
LSLHAEALVEPNRKSEIPSQKSPPVAFVFGPEHGAVSHKLVENAAIEAGARKSVEESDAAFGIPPPTSRPRRKT